MSSSTTKPKCKILCIDGGGVRGIIPCIILQEIERRLNKPISSIFDLIAGTSTGGIIALGLTIPQADGTLKFTPAVLRDLYAKNGKFKALEANDNESNSSVAPKTVDPVVLPDADATPFFLLSLGTALTEDSISLSDAKKYGMLSWIIGGKIIDLVMNGTSESTHYEMQYVLPDYPDGTKRYVRINPMLWKNYGYIDDTSDDNINRLIDLGNQTVKDNSDLLDMVCERLLE